MASLNQMVSNNYLRANLSAKRQRPPADPPEETGSVPASTGGADAAPAPAAANATANATTTAATTATTAATPAPAAPTAPVVAKPPPAKKLRASVASTGSAAAAAGNPGNVEGEITDAILAAAAKRHAAPEFLQPRPAARLADLAGIDAITAQVQELVFYPVRYPGLYRYDTSQQPLPPPRAGQNPSQW
jgi:hypothetical protein